MALKSARPIALSFQNVTHRYGSRVALHGLNLEVFQGEVLALLGPNGAGKSTTISALLGLLRPQEGRIEVLGSDPRQAVADGRVGAMLQSGSGIGLPPGARVDETLSLVRRLYRRPAPLAQIVEHADIGSLLRQRTDRLSGGQAQRVRFAIAIAGDPEIVFLDEPTAGLDPISANMFDGLVKDLQKSLNLTVFMVTHDLDTLRATTDRIAVLVDRKIVVGTIDELRRNPHPWIQEYFSGPRGRAAA